MSIPTTHRILHVALAGAVISALVACGGGAGEEAASGEAAETAEAGGSEASCVADYADAACDLLTEDLVRAQFPDAPQRMERDDYSSSSCAYTWSSDRTATREVAGRTMEYNESNTIGLSWIKTYEVDDPGDRFRREYLPTGAEMQRGRERMKQELDERAEEDEMTGEQREVAGNVAEAVGGDMSFEPVEGIGDMASWNGTKLFVLDGATSFQVESNVSAESSADRDAAIEVARALLAACE